ncbi:pickpocket protein 28-like, partial [Sitodiplosis mosellana]|uniref:pickpocket protein 28-like n=1 Tax=Sitodiplosis mosellana TaxID=263140 RepID=UPI002444D731
MRLMANEHNGFKGRYWTNPKVIADVLKEFCSNSTIHGVRYFTERRRHWTERCFWFIAIGLSFWYCLVSIQDMWIKWRACPVSMSFNEKDAPISAIPFPTVTICPETKAFKNKFEINPVYDSLMESNPWKLSNQQWVQLEALSHLCRFNFPEYVRYGNKFTNTSIYDIIQDIAPNLTSVIVSCSWNLQMENCESHFSPTITDEGLCFTFNALNSDEIYTDAMAPEMMIVKNSPNVSHWSLENGYPPGCNQRGYPIRVFNVKHSVSLTIFLQLFGQDIEYRCRGLIPGFKLFLHVPGEVQPASRHSFRVPLSEAVQISIIPKFIVTSDKLLSYKPQERQCFYNFERQLLFFKMYTQNNCELECLANFTRIECGCVKFSMPRTRRTHICGVSSIQCYQSAERKLYGDSDGSNNDTAKAFREMCQCLPSCTYVKYSADIDRAKLNWVESQISNRFHFHEMFGTQPSNLEIYFRDHEVTTMMRSEMYTTTNFIANCGGLLGLFLGISMLSIIEFIYYSTLRLY